MDIPGTQTVLHRRIQKGTGKGGGKELAGQFVQKMTLWSGQIVSMERPAKIKVPSKCGNHNIVFIADPDEQKNEPYPNSYMNNFINVTLRILCGGTIKGSGW